MSESARIETEIASDITSKLLQHHQKQLELCDRLESIADSLPNQLDRQECLSVSWLVYPVVKEAHRFEEEHLFPAVFQCSNNNGTIERRLERLRFEHWEDEASAEDLCIYLREIVSHPDEANIEKLSYMLRGFFEGLRRHIAYESDYLLPILPEGTELPSTFSRTQH